MADKLTYNHQVFLALEHWYHCESRDLPWRRDRSAYSVWISEVMLQQTQVSTVVDYYHRWMKRFPTIKKLSLATQDDVLLLWQGLGYYHRAAAIHKTARILAKDHGFQLPNDLPSLMKLPGIGRYTASAILSFAFQQVQPMVEVNIARVLHRFFFSTKKSTEDLWKISASILPAEGRNAALMNEALMELGATICLVRTPLCHLCPLSSFCRAHLLSKQKEALPVKKKKIVENVQSHVFLLSQFLDLRKLFAVLRRTHASRQKNLWCFPTLEHVPFEVMMDGENSSRNDCLEYFCPNHANLWKKSAKKVAKYIIDDGFQDALMVPFSQASLKKWELSPLFSFTHRYTQFKVKVFVWNVDFLKEKSVVMLKNCQKSTEKKTMENLRTTFAKKNNEILWVDLKKMDQLAMPVHHQSIKKYLFSLR